VEYASLLERAGERSRALTMYRYAIAVVGGDPRARHDAMQALKRLAGGGAGAIFLTFDAHLCLTPGSSAPNLHVV
jgi:hypothetical protein